MIIPGPTDIEAAWYSLPTETRDRIGLIALDMVFQAFVSGDAYSHDDRPVQDENLCHQACEASCKRLGQLHSEIEEALPALFGPVGENPAWSENPSPQPRETP